MVGSLVLLSNEGIAKSIREVYGGGVPSLIEST